MHYLDHNATSPLRPEARAAALDTFELAGNPSSIHSAGRQARTLIEESRKHVAALTGHDPQNVVFTSGGTEANALALSGAILAAADTGARITRLFVSAIEHGSVLANAEALAERVAGLRVEHLAVTTNGVVDLDSLSLCLREGKGRALIAVMAANNETGVVQPTSDIVRIAREASALVLVDAVQAAGKIAINGFDADYITLSAHKLGGLQGAGALVIRPDAPLTAQILGGGQQRGYRAGTENLVGIASFGAAAAVARSLSDVSRVEELRDRFECELRNLVPAATIFGAAAPRIANTSNFAVADLRAETALMALDLDGVMISSGAACSSGKVRPSHVLAAMGVPEHISRAALRVSFGWNSTEGDVNAIIASLRKLVSRKRAAA